jgi:hypothetical protein
MFRHGYSLAQLPGFVGGLFNDFVLKAQSSPPTYHPVVAHRRRETNVSMQHQ